MVACCCKDTHQFDIPFVDILNILFPLSSFLFLLPSLFLPLQALHTVQSRNLVEFRFEEYADSDTAIQAVRNVSNPPDGNFRVPSNAVSSYLLVTPIENVAATGQKATIVIEVDDVAPNSTKIYCANPESDWNFVGLTTDMRNGNAYAQTDQGGVFVAASGLNTAIPL